MDRAALFSTRAYMCSFDEKGIIFDFTMGSAGSAAGARTDRFLRRRFPTLITPRTCSLFMRDRRDAHQSLQRVNVRQIIQRFVDGSFRDECRICQALVIEQATEGLQPDGSLANILVAIELRAALGLGVVAMPHVHVAQSDGALQLIERVVVSTSADDVVPGDVSVAGVDAGPARHEVAQQVQQLCNLLEVTAQRELRSCGVLNQDAQVAGGQIESIRSLLDGQRHALQAFFTAAAAKRSGMQHQEFRLERKGAFHLSAKRGNRLGMKFRIASRQVHQVVGMDHQRMQVILGAQPDHLVTLLGRQVVGLPLPRARGKYLEGTASQTIGAFGCIRHSTCRRGVDADAPRRQLRRPRRRRQQLQDVLLFGPGCLGHGGSILPFRTGRPLLGRLQTPLSLPQTRVDGTLVSHKGLFMLVVMKANASEEQVRAVCQKIESYGLRAHAIPGAQRTAIGITGNRGEVETGTFESLEGVQEVIKVSKPYKLVSREVKAEDTIIRFPGSDASIGDNEIAVIAGPCGVESHEQAFAVAERVAKAGARFFRGGAYKPRTSPYAFQGLGELGLQILAEVRERFGLLIVTEAVDHESLALVDDYADVIQIGARNMQNFSLLKAAGRARKPVLLKRGMSATLEEFLMAAEYIMSEGNYNVILCERGVRTFADHTRNTLDLSVVPAVQRLSHLPILVDPSHGTGKRNKVTPLSRAAVAVGADGLIIEVHNDPDHALSDGNQSLY